MNQGYIGAWTNWSRGQILGATVTLTRQDASLVIAFTSTFIAFVVTRDATYHQIQAILRNAAALEDGIWLFLKILSMKRWNITRYHQLLFSATCGTILLISFTVLSGFSSSIATSDNEVLIQSAGCGYVFPDSGHYFDTITYYSKKINSAENYAQQCYSNEDHQFDCDHFVKKRITGTIDNNATCPFDSSVCLDERGNIRIDSGFINSHLHLGINAPTKERILWRNVLHGAPLTTASFSSLDTESQPNDVLFHYGNISTRSGSVDYMFRIPDLNSQYTNALSDTQLTTDINFYLDALKVAVKNGTVLDTNSDFSLIDALVRADADTHLMFFSGNGVVFSEHTNDVWYNVSTTATDVPITQANGYGTQQCSPLASLRDALASAAPLFETTYAGVANSTATTEKAARFIYFTNGFFAVNRDLAGVLGQLGSKALQSQNSLLVGFQGPLTSNQWQLDVAHCAYGQSNPGLEHSRVNYTASEFKSVCRNQKVKISYLVEPAFAWLHKRWSYGQYKYLEWTTNATLQLQRLAHEGIGQGTWSKGVRTVPTTKKDEPLALLGISNLEHPVLRPLLGGKDALLKVAPVVPLIPTSNRPASKPNGWVYAPRSKPPTQSFLGGYSLPHRSLNWILLISH
ncbi:hypothetical protein F4678DRAFT_469373 [Xylaria arbuscula]|nr:hypothetical protein F4678DRAFT_469373 [Xylaria arbuscula]